MNCTEIAPLLEDLLGGEIPEEAEASVRDHLAGCPGCRRAWEWMSFTREAFQALPPEGPRGGFEDRLGQILGIEIAPVKPIAPPESFLRRSLAFCRRQPGVQGALAASLLAATLGGGFYLKAPLPAGIPAVSEPMEARDEVKVPAPIAAPDRPAESAQAAPAPAPERRASLAPAPIETIRTKVRRALPSAPAAPLAPAAPEPEILLAKADPVAGLDAPPMLGYVRAQDLPSPLRCQMGGTWPDCRLETACQRPEECGAMPNQSAVTTE